VHEVFLRSTGLQNWALGAPRTGLVSQNKEGLTSFPGASSFLVFSFVRAQS